MGLTIKKPVKEIKASRPVCEIVAERLKSDPDNGYTIMGLMVECFNVKETEMNGKPFSSWRKGLPSLYTRVRLCLERLVKEGKVDKAKQERAGLYWWKS